MKDLVIMFLTIVVFCSCSNKTEQKQVKEIKTGNELNLDTIIGKKNITDEIAGSSYWKRATSYFTIVKNDTSGFMPIFSESSNDGRIQINQNLSYTNKNKTYFERINELKLILPEAAKEYNFDYLSSLSIGRLILTGDLAIMITEEYKNRFGENEKIATADYKEISGFLLETRLTKDLNELFEPYSKTVARIGVEKVFFTGKEELWNYSDIKRDSSEIPGKVLDLMVWIEFENK